MLYYTVGCVRAQDHYTVWAHTACLDASSESLPRNIRGKVESTTTHDHYDIECFCRKKYTEKKEEKPTHSVLRCVELRWLFPKQKGRKFKKTNKNNQNIITRRRKLTRWWRILDWQVSANALDVLGVFHFLLPCLLLLVTSSHSQIVSCHRRNPLQRIRFLRIVLFQRTPLDCDFFYWIPRLQRRKTFLVTDFFGTMKGINE